jgi:two-component system, NarL family, sensor histidine kinase DevS
MPPTSASPPAAATTEHSCMREARWREAAMRVQDAILSGADVDEVLEVVAGAARWLVDGDVATLATPRIEGQSLLLRAAVGYRAADLVGAVFPVEESLSGQVMTTRRPLHVPDATVNANAYQPICELGDMGATLLVPLERSGGAFGTLLVARRHGRSDFAATDLEMLSLFAGHVAVAVEFCRGQEELRRLAEVEATERIGRDLHDTVIQRLFATGLLLQEVSSRVPEDAVDSLTSVLHQLDGIVREIRDTVLVPDPRAG